ncbi:MAG TPA: phosphoglucomutase/phosphomannomutase family protein [Bacteroidetes bacterium]|nr:phosphoglucomutase/phosphomannomutase family protein [Bacteroidota bacterium]
MKTIKFGTDGWRAIIGDEYTVENLIRVTEGMATWLKKNFAQPSVLIGYDCRFNGRYFNNHVANVMAQQGVNVFIASDFVSTPMVSLAVHKRQLSAGIVITASHNPPEYSGFKIKGEFGGPAYPAIIDEVESYIPEVPGIYENNFEAMRDAGQIQYFDMEAVYLNHIRQNFDLEAIKASGLKFGYDAMYGAGQSAFRKLLPEARFLHAEFNPSFLGTAPEPIEKNLGEFQQVIRDEGLDLGIATDGDADRIGMFDENGDFVDSHHLLLLLIHYLHKVKGLQGKVVTTFSVTPKVAKMCELYGLPVEITKVGFKYICEIMLNEDVLVGGEESGGLAVTGHVPERDGIYIGMMVAEMMAKSGKKLTELVREIYDVVGAFNFQRNDLHLPGVQKDAIVARMKSDPYSEFGAYKVERVETLDGYKFFLPNEEWVMIRPSGTEPVLRIYAESSTREGAEAILKATISSITNA